MKATRATTIHERTELFALLFETGRLMKSEIARDNCPVPSFLHAETLRFIKEQGNPTMRDLAAYLKVTPPTVTALVDGFVKDRALARVPDPEDRRKVRLALTKKGQKLFADLQHRRAEAFTHILAPLTQNDRHELARILAVITRPRVVPARARRSRAR